MASQFETTPGDVQNNDHGPLIASCLFAVEPPTGFTPDFLNCFLADPEDSTRYQQMMSPMSSNLKLISNSALRTVFHVEALSTSDDLAMSRLNETIEALKEIISAEHGPLGMLEAVIDSERTKLFKQMKDK